MFLLKKIKIGKITEVTPSFDLNFCHWYTNYIYKAAWYTSSVEQQLHTGREAKHMCWSRNTLRCEFHWSGQVTNIHEVAQMTLKQCETTFKSWFGFQDETGKTVVHFKSQSYHQFSLVRNGAQMVVQRKSCNTLVPYNTMNCTAD